MQKEVGFNEIIRKIQKELFGKGPERIHTRFVDNMAVSLIYGSLTAPEKLMALEAHGRQFIEEARTKGISRAYHDQYRHGIEIYTDNKLLDAFLDFNVEEDVSMSVLVFENKLTSS
jgi:uncharacterized protein YbcI